MIVNSLIYWVREMGVDGFRFDLASVFARNPDGSINTNDPPIFGQIAAEPELQGVRLFAEPWDAAGAYQLGESFAGNTWRQWNGKYRDTIQRFLRSEPGLVAEMITRFYGSDDLFPDDPPDSYRPYQSVNYVVSHDGFTIYDLVSYDKKRNQANGENNTDGANEPSWNSGFEGDDGVPDDVLALRRQRIKNFFALLMTSNGTPMFRMGDEFAQTQGGNNNPYNQDNQTSWLDWTRLEENAEIFRFVRGMIRFRRDHPSLSRSTFWRGDVSWFGVDGPPDLSFGSRSFAASIRGAAENDVDIYVIVNSYWESLDFRVQAPGNWKVAVDTAQPSPDDIREPGAEPPLAGDVYTAGPRSVTVLIGD